MRGFFNETSCGHLHQQFFNHLLDEGFRRTPWQLIFPGQTAGIVRRMDTTESGANECHIRFYEDGSIDPELEIHRWGSTHWSGPRESGIEYVKTEIQTPSDLMEQIEPLLFNKGFSAECIR